MTLRAGVIAGAAGTTALNVVTYLDMALRARPASELPAKAAGEVTGRAGIELGTGKAGESRRDAIGALLGYATGLGVGALYALVTAMVYRTLTQPCANARRRRT
jgi:hypothetical protein